MGVLLIANSSYYYKHTQLLLLLNMDENRTTTWDSDLQEENPTLRRRDLLPLWIKIFTWFFMLLFFIVPILIIYGALGYTADLAIYGIETTFPLSPTGIFLSSLFVLKGITAIALWTERDWAIRIGLIDAVLGIAICTYIMLVQPFMNESGFAFTIRLELVALIPYLIKLIKIRPDWEKC